MNEQTKVKVIEAIKEVALEVIILVADKISQSAKAISK